MAKNTITAIADKLGVSKTTVGYVLSGNYRNVNISPVTAGKIREVAEKVGYRPNHWARSLARKRSQTIGIIYPDLSGASAHEITEGIKEILGRDNYDEILGVSFWDLSKERNEIKLMLEKQVEGIIALPQAMSEQTYKLVKQDNCPLVFVGDYLPEIEASSVTLDPQDTVFKSLNHLHQLGHTKIFMISVDYKSTTLNEREGAFLVGMKRLGLDTKTENIFRVGIGDDIAIYEKIRLITSLENRPTALLCISDSVAFSVFSELSRLKVRIPDDLAVASIGNLQMSEHPFFSLTTVDECRKEMGREAARMVLRHIEKKGQGQDCEIEHVRLKGSLFTRRSTIGV